LKAYSTVKIVTLNEDKKELDKLIEYCEKNYDLSPKLIDFQETSTHIKESKNTIVFLFLSEKFIKQFLKSFSQQKINVALLPHEESNNALKRYGIQKNVFKAFDDGMNKLLRIEDELLLCNNEVSFKKISIGNVQNLSQNMQISLFQSIKNFFINLRQLKYQNMQLKTNNKSFKQALSGVLILEDYTIYSSLDTHHDNSFHDGQLNAFLIAPYSLISYIYYLIVIFLYHRFSIGSLPKNIGFVSTTSLASMMSL
jgi:hypothetical protein